jgi:hypothetical protein
MMRHVVGLVLMVVGTMSNTFADEAKTSVLTGAWTREVDDVEIVLNFQPKNTLQATVTIGDHQLKTENSYTVDKKGNIQAEIKSVKTQGDFPAEVIKGLKYSFKFEVHGKTATVSEFIMAGMAEASNLMEGKYTPKQLDK